MPHFVTFVKETIQWIDFHPRTGWYVALVVTLNLMVNILSLLH